jgi:inosine/xanthosine triphosphate pyrophosphatase family protein
MDGRTFASSNKKQTNKMKKVFALFAITGMLFASSCGNKEVSEESTEEIEVVIDEPEVAPEVMEESVEDSTVVVEEVEG